MQIILSITSEKLREISGFEPEDLPRGADETLWHVHVLEAGACGHPRRTIGTDKATFMALAAAAEAESAKAKD